MASAFTAAAIRKFAEDNKAAVIDPEGLEHKLLAVIRAEILRFPSSSHATIAACELSGHGAPEAIVEWLKAEPRNFHAQFVSGKTYNDEHTTAAQLIVSWRPK